MPEETKQKEEFVHFKLGEKRAIFRTQDKSINLSLFENHLYGKIGSSDRINFVQIINAIRNGDLIDTKKEMSNKVEDKQQLVDVTNIAEEKVRHKRDATQLLRKLKKDELIERVEIIKNPYLIAAMIEQESRGRNVSKRRREDVMKLLKKRLELISKDLKGQAVMTQYLEETDEQYKVKRDQNTSAEQDF